MIKIGKKTKWALIVLLGPPLIIYTLITLTYTRNENTTKRLLEDEVANLGIPPACTEVNRQYQTGGIDTISGWTIRYTCQTTGKVAYDSVIKSLASLGYQEELDYSKQGPGIFYTFTYSSDKFTARYDFKPPQHPTLSTEQRPQLEVSPVNAISLELTRKYLP